VFAANNGSTFSAMRSAMTLFLNLKKSVELNPAKNIQHKLDRPTAGMSFI